MKKQLLAMLASAALTLSVSVTAFADEPISPADDHANPNTPAISKQVKDLDGTAAVNSEWQDAADCDIQAHVPFRLSAQLPDDFEAYKAYELVFHDTMSKSLTFDENSLKVYCETADGEQVVLFGDGATNPVESISLATTDIPKGETFNVIIPDARAIPDATAGTTIYVEYTATLNDKAVTGAIETGNPNRMYITYPESPESDALATSPKALATVFTYKVTIECQDDQGDPLPGAEFKIYRRSGEGYQELVDNQFITDAGGSIFTARGIDEGQYRISEVTAPAGSTPIPDTYFTIVGTYGTGDHGVQLTKYEYVLTDEAGNPLSTSEEAAFYVDKDKGNLSRTVVHANAHTSIAGGFDSRMLFAIAGAIIAVGVIITVIALRKKSAK